jgi:hypothetical protein
MRAEYHFTVAAGGVSCIVMGSLTVNSPDVKLNKVIPRTRISS